MRQYGCPPLDGERLKKIHKGSFLGAKRNEEQVFTWAK